jgi:hypothetical protein
LIANDRDDQKPKEGVVRRYGASLNALAWNSDLSLMKTGRMCFSIVHKWKGCAVIVDGTPVSFVVTMGQRGLRALAVQIEKSNAPVGVHEGARKGGLTNLTLFSRDCQEAK